MNANIRGIDTSKDRMNWVPPKKWFPPGWSAQIIQFPDNKKGRPKGRRK